MSKIYESQKRAKKKWDEENKDKKRYLSHRARARSFLRDVATLEDLDEMEQVLETRRKSLKEEGS